MHRLLGTRLQPNYGDRLRLDDEDLQTAAHLYGQWLAEADKRLQQALGLVLDPLMHCFICQHTLRTHLDDGELNGPAVHLPDACVPQTVSASYPHVDMAGSG